MLVPLGVRQPSYGESWLRPLHRVKVESQPCICTRTLINN